MAILDSFMNPQTPEEQALAMNPQTLPVLGNIQNGLNLGVDYNPTQSPVMQDASMAPQAPVDQTNTPASSESQDSSEGGVGGFLKGFMNNFANAMTNPDVINTLGAFGASMSNDMAGYNANMNAYTQRMDDRRKEAAAAARAQTDQSWREKQARVDALYDAYTPESVNAYNQSGDFSVLVPNMKYQLQQQRANQGDARIEQGGTRLDQQGRSLDLRAQGQADTRNYQSGTLQIAQDRLKNDMNEFSTNQANKVQEREDKQTEKSNAQWEEQQKTIDSTTSTLNSARDIANDSNFDNFFGFVAGRLPNLTTGSQALASRFNMLKSQQFLSGVTAMKGMGALSDAEGAKISAAQARLFNADGTVNQRLSASEARTAMNEIISTYESGIAKAKAIQGTRQAPSYASTPEYQAATSGALGSGEYEANLSNGRRAVLKDVNGQRQFVRYVN